MILQEAIPTNDFWNDKNIISVKKSHVECRGWWKEGHKESETHLGKIIRGVKAYKKRAKVKGRESKRKEKREQKAKEENGVYLHEEP